MGSLIKKTTVVSPPGAAIKIESVELTDEGKRLLTVPEGSMDKFAIGKYSNPKKEKLVKKILKLQNELYLIEKKERDEEKSKIELLPNSIKIDKKIFCGMDVEHNKNHPPMIFVSQKFLDDYLIPRIGTSRFPNYKIKFPFVTDIICPSCEKGNIVAEEIEPKFSGGMDRLSTQHHVGDNYICRCNKCNASFYGDITWMHID
jgi:hypothetical protein